MPIELTIASVDGPDGHRFNAFVRSTTQRFRLLEERRKRIREQSARMQAEELAERAQRLQALTDVALVEMSVEGLLAELLRRLCSLIEVEAASILLLEPGAEELVVRASTAALEQPVRIPIGAGFAWLVAARRGPVLEQNPDLEQLCDPALRLPEVTSLIGIPLIGRDGLIGVMQAAAVVPRRFDEDDLALMALAGERVALALDRVAVYEREHRIAETLQRTLLPARLPERPGLALAARYVPASAEAAVGGDWYDAVELADGQLAVALGDVEGKGLRAASLVGGLRSAFRAYAFDRHGPAEIARRLNELLLNDSEHAEIATLWTCLFDPASGSLVHASAGHPQPLIVAAAGAPRYLHGGGSVPLGVLPAIGYEEHRARLAAGDLLVAFSDGLVESRSRPLAEGLELLLAAAAGRDPGLSDPSDLCDHLIASMVLDSARGDDVALLALGPAPLAGRFQIEVSADPRALAGVRGLLERLLDEAGVSDDEAFAAIVAAGEACNNAIEHAYGPRATAFDLDVRTGDGEVRMAVRDRGQWRAQRGADQGRGLSLMRALMDSVEVETNGEGTVVTLVKRIGSPVVR